MSFSNVYYNIATFTYNTARRYVYSTTEWVEGIEYCFVLESPVRSGRESDRFLFSGSILSVGEYIARAWMGTASLFVMAASLQGVCTCGGQLRQVRSFAFLLRGVCVSGARKIWICIFGCSTIYGIATRTATVGGGGKTFGIFFAGRWVLFPERGNISVFLKACYTMSPFACPNRWEWGVGKAYNAREYAIST